MILKPNRLDVFSRSSFYLTAVKKKNFQFYSVEYRSFYLLELPSETARLQVQQKRLITIIGGHTKRYLDCY